jgi:hypothetical protein
MMLIPCQQGGSEYCLEVSAQVNVTGASDEPSDTSKPWTTNAVRRANLMVTPGSIVRVALSGTTMSCAISVSAWISIFTRSAAAGPVNANTQRSPITIALARAGGMV